MASEISAATGRTFRVFVSSTFADLKPERNALQAHVFPRLRELCALNGARFQAIDLRWGISEEAALDQQTIPICLREVERSQAVSPRPNFVVLLGDRYGWEPLPAYIREREWNELTGVMSQGEVASLARLYRKDENRRDENGNAEWCLLPRDPDGRYADPDAWRIVEDEVREIFRSAIPRSTLDAEARLSFEASATEQEIREGALDRKRVPDADEHVFCFFRKISPLPTGPAAKDFVDLDADAAPNTNARVRLEDLRRNLEADLGSNVHHYEARWEDDRVSEDHIGSLPDSLDECLELLDVSVGGRRRGRSRAARSQTSLCVDVWKSLAGIILKEIENLSRVDPLTREIAAHRSFGVKRSEAFTGRVDELRAIGTYLDDPNGRVLAIAGEAGSGKSALMARAAGEAEGTFGEAVMSRYIGATPESSDIRSLLRGLCEQIGRRIGVDTPLPVEYQQLVAEFWRRLETADRKNVPIVLFLDAIDQLSDTERARNLAWLPTELGPRVRVVASVLSGDPRAEDSLRALGSKAGDLHLLGPLEPNERSELLDHWMADAGRTISEPGQQRHLEDRLRGNGLPLYLRLVFEEARLWKSYDEPTPLGRDTEQVIRLNLIPRLSHKANHGETLVAHGLGYLAAARNGLSEDEMLDILSRDNDVFQNFLDRSHPDHRLSERRLPIVVWSRLFAELEPYLAQRQADGATLISFFHRQLADIVGSEFLGGKKEERHRALADYFDELELRLGAADGRVNIRKVSELPFQQSQASSLLPGLQRTLTDLDFVRAKCEAGLTYDLVTDYRRGEQKWTGGVGDAHPIIGTRATPELVSLFGDFVASHAHVFARDPSQVLVFAHNYADGGPVAQAADELLTDEDWRRNPWIELRERSPLLRKPALLRILEGHAGEVTGVALSRDGRRAASGSMDGTVRVWESETGVCLRTISAHSQGVNDVALSSDGGIVASAGVDGVACTWDSDTGRRLATVGEEGGEAFSVALSDDGHLVVVGGADGIARVWDLDDPLGLPRIMTRHFAPINAVAITADGRTVASGSQDSDIRVSRVGDGEPVGYLSGHTVAVQGVAIDDAGAKVVSASGQPAGGSGLGTHLDESEVRFWNSAGTCLATRRGHDIGHRGGWLLGVLGSLVHDVALTPDGRIAISGGYDRAVAVWDGDRFDLLGRLMGHRDAVRSVAIDASGELGISGSMDRTARLWDLDGQTVDELPWRIGHVGSASKRHNVADKAILVFRNRFIRTRVIDPIAAAPLGAGWYAGTLAIGRSFPGPEAIDVGVAYATAFLLLWSIDWRRQLRADTHVSKAGTSRFVRWLLGFLLLPILPFFKVLDCPQCGHAFSGRRRMFSCSYCGWQDRPPARRPQSGARRARRR